MAIKFNELNHYKLNWNHKNGKSLLSQYSG